MKKLLLAALLWSFATPALAAEFDVPGCGSGKFGFISRNTFGIEQGKAVIEDDILVTRDDGLANIGAHDRVKGTVIADRIFLGTGAVVDNCIADVITGPGVCSNVLGTFSAAPAACKTFTFTVPPVDPCVNVGLAVNVPAGDTEILPPGCYGLVRVGLGGTLELQDGVYLFGNLLLQIGATLEGTTAGRSKVFVKSSATISTVSKLSHLDLFTSAAVGDSLVFGNGVKFDDVRAVAAGSGIHLHTGFAANNSAFAAIRVVVEPGITSHDVDNPVCACPAGTKLPPGVLPQQCIPIL